MPVYTQQLLDTWPHMPAYVLGRYSDVLAANALAGALHPSFTQGSNLLRTIFLDPDARDFYTDWDRVARGYVAALRASATPVLDDSRFNELVGGLSLGSETFRRLWGRHDVRGKTHATRLNHPIVGELELYYTSFSLDAAADQQLVVYHAEPDTPAAQALTLLSKHRRQQPIQSRGRRGSTCPVGPSRYGEVDSGETR